MSNEVILNLSKINSTTKQSVVDAIIQNANHLGLLFRADVINNKLIIYCV